MAQELSDATREWMALSFVTGIGSRTAAMLIDKFGSPGACFKASRTALESAGLKREAIDQLTSREPFARADRDMEALAGLGAKVLVLKSRDYPQLLKETYDPPIVLYSLGDVARALSQPLVAIIGSRRCSTYGRNVAQMLARELGSRGVTIVSGMARGIDHAAHAGALEGGGLTVAVMGTGIDSVYPKEHRRLAEQIRSNGALITEFPIGSPPLPQNFPFRNRVISGLSLGVVVVEAAERSGSLITARLAYEQGREVFAVPGNITSANSFGPNYLIKDGAKLVQTWRDVVEEFPAEIKAPILAAERGEPKGEQLVLDEVALSEQERKVLALLDAESPTHIDLLISGSGLGAGELMGALLKLEVDDRVRQLPGKTYLRKL